MSQHSHEGPPELKENWIKTLRNQGRRVTKQRLAVLNAVQANPHSTAETIATAVRQEIPTITVQSVYVVLTDLVGIGMLRRFGSPSSPARYESQPKNKHHHDYCVRCSKIEDVYCPQGKAPCLHPSQLHGMALLAADVLYQGICTDCQTHQEAELAAAQSKEFAAEK